MSSDRNIVFDVLGIFFIFVCGMVGGLIPIFLRTRETLLSCAHCVAGGVFFSAAVVHMLPDSDDQITQWFEGLNSTENEKYLQFPLASVCSGFGFFLVLLTERVLLPGGDSDVVKMLSPSTAETLGTLPLLDHDALGDADYEGEQHAVSERANPASEEQHPVSASTADGCAVERRVLPSALRRPSASATVDAASLAGVKRRNISLILDAQSSPNVLRTVSAAVLSNIVSMPSAPVLLTHIGYGESAVAVATQPLEEITGTTAPRKPWLALVLLLVLSIHSFLGGLALGLSDPDSTQRSIFIAIIAHKAIAALSLGTALVRAKLTNSRLILLVLFFSTTTPLGAALGVGIRAGSNGDSLGLIAAQGIITGLASGSFLYVAILVTIAEEFSAVLSRRFLIGKFFLCLLGFCAMSITGLWT